MDVRLDEEGRVTVRSAAVVAPGEHTLADLGAWNEQGELSLTGRATPLANIGGKKVSPLEIERVLRGLEGVTDAWVGVRARPSGGEDFLLAAVETERSGEDVRAALAERLPAWQVPRRLWVDAAPAAHRTRQARPERTGGAVPGGIRGRAGIKRFSVACGVRLQPRHSVAVFCARGGHPQGNGVPSRQATENRRRRQSIRDARRHRLHLFRVGNPGFRDQRRGWLGGGGLRGEVDHRHDRPPPLHAADQQEQPVTPTHRPRRVGMARHQRVDGRGPSATAALRSMNTEKLASS